MSQESIRIALAQVKCALGDAEANLSAMQKVLKEHEADLYVFPELFLTGYMIRDEVFTLAAAADSSYVQRMQKMAAEKDVRIICGLPVRDDLLYNSALVISPDSVEVYRKNHLANFGPFEEGLYFSEGDSILLTEINGFRFGIIICYDLFFPETAVEYAMNRMDCLVCISASPISSRNAFESVLPARAVENASYVIFVNQTGVQLNQVFFGGSEARDPSGRLMVKNAYFSSDVSVITLHKSQLRLARQLRPTMRSRRERNIDVVDQ